MTEIEFGNQTERLCNLFGKKLNDEQKIFWFDSLKNYGVEKYRRAVGEYAKKNKSMPTIADILETIRQLKPYEQTKKESEVCKACKGTGYVMYHKIIEGISYEYVALCNCKNAIGNEYDSTQINDKEHRSQYYIPKATDIYGIGGTK